MSGGWGSFAMPFKKYLRHPGSPYSARNKGKFKPDGYDFCDLSKLEL